jgi:hypothetical protein
VILKVDCSGIILQIVDLHQQEKLVVEVYDAIGRKNKNCCSTKQKTSKK